MNSVTIKDYFSSRMGVVEGVEPQLLLAAVADDGQNEGKFLSVEYVKVHVRKLGAVFDLRMKYVGLCLVKSVHGIQVLWDVHVEIKTIIGFAC